MYEKNDKRKLYWLIDQYLSGKMNETTFCDEFHYSFNEVNEFHREKFTDIEYEYFSDLDDAVQCFTEYEEDFKLWSGFITAKQLREKVIETKENLKKQKMLYDKLTKQKLYNLIDQYLSNKINEVIFCNDFHNVFVNDVYYDGLTNIEHEAFSYINAVTQCFTDNDDYLKLWPSYITAKQLREKILETQGKFKS